MTPAVLIVGATGYAGSELAGLVDGHPALTLAAAMRARPDAPAVPAGPSTRAVEPLDVARFADVDGVFLCTPHGAAAPLARTALEAGARVVDLSADFRLRDAALYEATYGAPHPAPDLLDASVYGLTEHARAEVRTARLVANPGCYPTSILLPLLPLLAAGVVHADAPIVADSKSGVSGAGRAPSEVTHFGNVHDNFRAYGVGAHRHTPEIHQVAGTDRIAFVPHLLPCERGILSTLHFAPAAGCDASVARGVLDEAYAHEPFVTVYPAGPTPELRAVQRTNTCHVSVHDVGPVLTVVSALDNLVKGAAGQALQNMNLLLGLEETLGLRSPAGEPEQGKRS
ncbi:MAG: N-acetyl-gamma-glutamyl-phosphate reductase [bacterium]|nr:N-acetyl-gamma-glutamyl-phosphate reductase [bacterium]